MHTDVSNYDFDCNIQQVKITCFDCLYYVLFFFDLIAVFKILPDQIINDTNIAYSDKQHRGNAGEGQFHINDKTYDHHKNNYFERSFSYQEMKGFNRYQKISNLSS